ncbi:MAG: HAD family hydrolase [Phycisphaeraceae bacterium]
MSDTNPTTTGPRLVLFDIDGTLMITKGASSRCMKRAGEIVLGPTFKWHPITVGTLDPQIFDQLARANGITPTPAQRLRYEEIYLDELERELYAHLEDITVMPGIEQLVERLHERALEHGDVLLGVLTGNFRRATELKLALSGLGLDRFHVVVCAEEGATRDDLPKAALRLAEQHAGQAVLPEQTYILGDTPRDIQCAQANGCVSISVATGRYSAEQLRGAGGQIVFDSFEPIGPVLDCLGIER